MMQPLMASQACDCQEHAQLAVDRLNQGATCFRTITRAQIMRCPLTIFDPDHYKPDGTCLCFDIEHQDKLLRDRQARRQKVLDAQKR